MFGSKPVDPAANKQPDPNGRTILGRPVTKADARTIALRESGYAGPVDQNGDRVPPDRVDPALTALAQLPDYRQADDR